LFVVASLALLGAANAEECATAELLSIASNTHLEGCTSAVGFVGFSAIWDLTEEQVKAVCASSDCLALMDAMRSMGFGDCIIAGTSVALNTDILDPFAKACSGSGSTDYSSSVSVDTVGSSAGESSSTSRASRSATLATLVCTAVVTVTTFLF
jgi:hypothetical protein